MRSRGRFPSEVLAVIIGGLLGWATTTPDADRGDRPPVEASGMEDARPFDQPYRQAALERSTGMRGAASSRCNVS